MSIGFWIVKLSYTSEISLNLTSSTKLLYFAIFCWKVSKFLLNMDLQGGLAYFIKVFSHSNASIKWMKWNNSLLYLLKQFHGNDFPLFEHLRNQLNLEIYLFLLMFLIYIINFLIFSELCYFVILKESLDLISVKLMCTVFTIIHTAFLTHVES